MPCQLSIASLSSRILSALAVTPKERATKVAEDFRRDLIAGGNPSIISMVTEAIEDFKEAPKEPPKCDDHPTYQGMRTPRNNCEACWRLYLFKKDSK